MPSLLLPWLLVTYLNAPPVTQRSASNHGTADTFQDTKPDRISGIRTCLRPVSSQKAGGGGWSESWVRTDEVNCKWNTTNNSNCRRSVLLPAWPWNVGNNQDRGTKRRPWWQKACQFGKKCHRMHVRLKMVNSLILTSRQPRGSPQDELER